MYKTRYRVGNWRAYERALVQRGDVTLWLGVGGVPLRPPRAGLSVVAHALGRDQLADRSHLNEHWFTSLAHAQALIETWRREYNEERPKKGRGGLTPARYAKQLVVKGSTVTVGL